MYLYVALLVFLVMFLSSAIRILNEYERGVVFRLGRVIGAKGPGLILLVPVIDKMVKVDLRVVAMDGPPQDVITRDNVSVKVSAVLYFRVIDPNRAIIGVENYLYATSQLSQTTLRSVCGQAELDDLLAEREKINAHIQEILDKDTEPWGSRSRRWRSSTSTFPRRCSGPWPNRPRPKGSGNGTGFSSIPYSRAWRTQLSSLTTT